jgi:hypothetical protein
LFASDTRKERIRNVTIRQQTGLDETIIKETEPNHMVRPYSENGRRKITQNSTEVDAKTKESTRKPEEKLDGRYKKGHERKNLNEDQWEDRKQWSLGFGQGRKAF